MKRPWHIIAVNDVQLSSTWYTSLLDAKQLFPQSNVFNQILDSDDFVLLSLHWWGPSGPKRDHEWPPLLQHSSQQVGHGMLLWFVVDDFDNAWKRAQEMGALIHESPNTNNGTGMRAFVVRDPDGYYVAINDMHK